MAGTGTLLYILSQKLKSDVISDKVAVSSVFGVNIAMFISFTTFCYCFIFNGDANLPMRSYEGKISVVEYGAYDYEHFQEFTNEVARLSPLTLMQ